MSRSPPSTPPSEEEKNPVNSNKGTSSRERGSNFLRGFLMNQIIITLGSFLIPIIVSSAGPVLKRREASEHGPSPKRWHSNYLVRPRSVVCVLVAISFYVVVGISNDRASENLKQDIEALKAKSAQDAEEYHAKEIQLAQDLHEKELEVQREFQAKEALRERELKELLANVKEQELLLGALDIFDADMIETKKITRSATNVLSSTLQLLWGHLPPENFAELAPQYYRNCIRSLLQAGWREKIEYLEESLGSDASVAQLYLALDARSKNLNSVLEALDDGDDNYQALKARIKQGEAEWFEALRQYSNTERGKIRSRIDKYYRKSGQEESRHYSEVGPGVDHR